MPFDPATLIAGGGFRFDLLPEDWALAVIPNQAEANRQIPPMLAAKNQTRVLLVSPEEPIDLHSHLLPKIDSSLYGPCGPDDWEGKWGCESGHLSTRYLKSERLGNVCLSCHKPIFAIWRQPAWVIVQGGDTPLHPAWVRSIRDQCKAAGVPFCFAGWGAWVTLEQSEDCMQARDRGHNPGFCPIGLNGEPTRTSGADSSKGDVTVYKFGATATGRMLDGRQHMDMPKGKI